jgi:hypothetical protein
MLHNGKLLKGSFRLRQHGTLWLLSILFTPQGEKNRQKNLCDFATLPTELE